MLAPKISVVVDGGGRFHCDALPADIRLRAVPAPLPRLCIGIGGDAALATWIGAVAPGEACGAVAALLRAIAAIGPTARAADLLAPPRSFGALMEGNSIAVAACGPPPPRPPAELVGVHRLRAGRQALGIALAFGHSDAQALARLAGVAAQYGVTALHPAPSRVLMLYGEGRIPALAVAAEQLGFITCAHDPRRRIVACPGAPGCGSAFFPARAMAMHVAPLLVPDSAADRESATIHLSGCHKGCAHPAPAAVTVVGTETGCGIVRDGSARAVPHRLVTCDALGPAIAAEIARLSASPGAAND